VKRGQDIKRGDLIGQVGNTGRSTASHLHYEVHYFGTPQDPEHYFLARNLK
jgi:murein DD-endopeptidase MepM/ murein hydrolase activator NlpD